MWWIALGAVVVLAIPGSIVLVLVSQRTPARRAHSAAQLIEAAAAEGDPDRRRQLFAAAAERIEPLVNQPQSSERDRDAALVMGYLRFEQERYADAVQWFGEALRRPIKRDLRRRVLECLVVSAAASGDNTTAHDAFERLARMRLTDAAGRSSLDTATWAISLLHARRGEFDQAHGRLRELENRARSAAQRLDVRELRALIAYYTEDQLVASTMIESALEGRRAVWSDKKTAPLTYQLARTHLHKSQIQLAGGDREGALLSALHGLEIVPPDRPLLAANLALAAARGNRRSLDPIAATAAELADRVLLALISAERVRRDEEGTSPARAVLDLDACGEQVEGRWLSRLRAPGAA